ncbi:predicted protein [Sclerotinia sclerotiorum 1980 UF-70]|uniref:Uncharacterized protein n=2 Tax=Sclerotinia sclerotiorum (strain ATCC 18683 / 1980 / Ss-1) TaxID=665079 RepID=A7ED14_SCLS1|nr:predicted protein [Sclerotinia sclerotiorum 1980 UF-70]APA11068.1 hypothetical protein sscle_07g058380 [Sclerotinia sclerotiorum 1980 UF-70]EDO00730.1 predicted protein [Sclerotinia sclerotiorum 1980 UF-70]
MAMAEYERELLLVSKTRLRSLADKKVRNVVDIFFSVTDSYGYIYLAIARGITTRLA